MHLTYINRVVGRAKGLAVLCRSVPVGILITRCRAIVVVVAHSVKERCRITDIGKCTAEIAYVVEVVVPVNLVCAVAKAEGVDRNASLTILLNLGSELWYKDVAEVAQIVVVVGNVDVGYGSYHVAVVVYCAQVKVVALGCSSICCELCPELRNNISPFGHSLISARNSDKNRAVSLLRDNVILPLLICQHNLVAVRYGHTNNRSALALNSAVEGRTPLWLCFKG